MVYEILKCRKLKINVVLSWLTGCLFYINGFNKLWAFLLHPDDLEFLREGGMFYMSTPLHRISSWLYFISVLGLIGLIVASVISSSICKKLKLPKLHVIVVFVIAYIINEPLMGNFEIFEYRNSLFKNANMHVFFLVSFSVTILIGTAFLILPIYFRYFKYSNPGGVP